MSQPPEASSLRGENQPTYGTTSTMSTMPVMREPTPELDSSALLNDAPTEAARHRRQPSSDSFSFSSLHSSSYFSGSVDENVDELRIYDAAREAGRSAFGVIGVEVWLLDNESRFTQAGLWVSPVFRGRHPSDALERVLNPEHPKYSPAVPQVPGAGLAGYFWALGTETPGSKQLSAPLGWREVRAITSDPFQPPYARMSAMEEAGFGKAVGIPFDIMGQRGIVIFLARKLADNLLLNDPANVTYLRVSAQHIGSAVALTRPRLESIEAKRERMRRTYRRIKTKVESMKAFADAAAKAKSSQNVSNGESVTSGEVEQLRRKCSFLEIIVRWFQTILSLGKKKVVTAVKKSRGSELKPPPTAPWLNTTWCFVGSFLTLLALTGIDTGLKSWVGEGFLLPPLCALITLQFSLTAAPPSQPRTIIYGEIIAMAMALLAQEILVGPSWLRLAIAGALVIAIMAKVGVAHPPAAAAIIALLSKPGGVDWKTVCLFFLGNLISVFMGIFINNLSEQRQYPVYWAFGFGTAFDSLRSVSRILRCPGKKKGSTSSDNSVEQDDNHSIGHV